MKLKQIALGVVGTLAALGGSNVALADSSAAKMKNCPAEDWCSYHREADKSWAHSPLSQINPSNVKNLRPAWIFQPGNVRMGMHSTPLAVGGDIYVATNPSTVTKLDGATGALKWQWVPKLDEAVVARSFFAHTRGLAIGDGRVYMGTVDGRFVALDENTGKEVWSKQMVDSKKDTVGFSGAATFVNSDLIVMAQNGGEYPIEGKIWGIDPKNGEIKWTFYTTGRNDPKAMKTWRGDSWQYGGGGSWQPGTVDYANNQIIMGTGNPNPDYDYCGKNCRNPESDGWRSGDALYTSSNVALDLTTGKLNWYFQHAHADPYDYDAAPGELVILGDKVFTPGKNGFNHVFDAKTGKVLNVYPDMKNANWTTGYNIAKGEWENMLWPEPGKQTLVCPAIDGGHSWNGGSYSPKTKLFYRVVQEWCMKLTVQPKGGGTTISAGSEQRVLAPFVQAFMSAEWIGTNPPNDTNHGRLTARDPVTGKLAWEKRYDLIPHSTLLSTGGDLLFIGTADGYVQALDPANGNELWKFNVGSGVHGGIISYSSGGKQYIAVASGHGTYVGRAVQSLNKDKIGHMQESMAVVVFALP
jgi:PQQ-dependent dehydrogenase (methanol/ethanol family)